MQFPTQLFILLFFISTATVYAQDCSSKGNLVWLKDGQLLKEGQYNADDSIIGFFYNPKALDSLSLDLRIGEKEMSILVPLFPLDDFPKHSLLKNWRGKYSKLVFIPSPYPKMSTAYQQLAKAIAATGQTELNLIYRGADIPLAGCLKLNLSQGLGQYDLSEDLLALEEFNQKKKAILQRIQELKKLEQEKLQFLKLEKDRRKAAEDNRLQLREKHKNLSSEEQAILNELIEKSNKVGQSLNQALLSNDKAAARVVAELTGDYQKRLSEIKKMPIYTQIKSSFDNYYYQSTIYFTHDRNVAELERDLEALAAKIEEQNNNLKTLEAKIASYLKSEK